MPREQYMYFCSILLCKYQKERIIWGRVITSVVWMVWISTKVDRSSMLKSLERQQASRPAQAYYEVMLNILKELLSTLAKWRETWTSWYMHRDSDNRVHQETTLPCTLSRMKVSWTIPCLELHTCMLNLDNPERQKERKENVMPYGVDGTFSNTTSYRPECHSFQLRLPQESLFGHPSQYH